MTLIQNRQYRAVTSTESRYPQALAAAEWDITSFDSRPGNVGAVRTLSISSSRTHLEDRERIEFDDEAVEQFETHREKREGFFVGIGLGIALIVGSALGGAFSGDQALTPTPAQAEFAFYAQQ